MKNIYEMYTDNELLSQVKEKLEKADNFKLRLEIHSKIKNLETAIEKETIGIKIRGQK